MNFLRQFGIILFVISFNYLSNAQMTHIDVTAEQSLRVAIDFCAANNVDSIILVTSGGVYAEADTFLYQISRPITIIAKEGLAEKPVIVNTNQSFDKTILEIFRVSDHFVLKGVILDGGYEGSRGMKYGVRVGPNAVTGVEARNGLNITIEDVDFKNFYEAGTGQGHAFYFLKDVFAGTVRIENCTINGTGYEAIRLSETEKYACTRCVDTLIVRNVTFENIPAEVIRFYADLDTTTQDAYLLFENLTVNKCNIRMVFIKNNKNTILRNVIITNDFDGITITGQDRKDYIMDVQSSGSVVSHIDTFNVFPVPIKATKGGFVDAETIYGFDPMYEDEENSNYTLLPESPAYGVGYEGTHLGDLRWAKNEPVFVNDNTPVLADNYKLNQNFPNPFNPTTAISFYLPKEGNVSIDVFNIIGQKVDEIVNTHFSSGEHTIRYEGSKLHSGVYFYSITAGGYNETRKMLLLK